MMSRRSGNLALGIWSLFGAWSWELGASIGPRSICLFCLMFLLGCRATFDLPPVDLTQPGWQVRQGQAVWRPSANGPELTGELVWAAHPDGRFLLQFFKTPITMVE